MKKNIMGIVAAIAGLMSTIGYSSDARAYSGTIFTYIINWDQSILNIYTFLWFLSFTGILFTLILSIYGVAKNKDMSFQSLVCCIPTIPFLIFYIEKIKFKDLSLMGKFIFFVLIIYVLLAFVGFIVNNIKKENNEQKHED